LHHTHELPIQIRRRLLSLNEKVINAGACIWDHRTKYEDVYKECDTVVQQLVHMEQSIIGFVYASVSYPLIHEVIPVKSLVAYTTKLLSMCYVEYDPSIHTVP